MDEQTITDDLVKAPDSAHHRAKRAGRNRFSWRSLAQASGAPDRTE